MDVSKAKKKEKSRNKIFYTVMIFIAILLPTIMYITSQTQFYYLIILLVIECLIAIAIIANINNFKITYNISNNKMRIKQGLFNDSSMILCDSVSIVHTYNKAGELHIVIITDKKIRNKYMKIITTKFLKHHPQIEKKYEYLESVNPDSVYYRYIVKSGGINKYLLLNDIYTNCVKSLYTDNAIEDIKIARGQKNIQC